MASLAGYGLYRTETTTPFMPTHAHNKGFLLRSSLVALFLQCKYNALLLEPERITNVSLISNTVFFAVVLPKLMLQNSPYTSKKFERYSPIVKD